MELKFKTKNLSDAQRAMTQLLLQYCGENALGRAEEEARASRQSLEEVMWRTSGNLLRFFKMRKNNY